MCACRRLGGRFRDVDGELVVATGSGVELVAPGTGAAEPICTEVVLCGHPAQPRVSPNGRAIAFVDTASGRAVVVAPDGSCLWCLLGAPLTRLVGSDPGFTPGGEAVTVARGGLWRISLAGGGARRLVKGPVNGAVWSSRGLVALVREGWIWAGRPGHGKFRRLVRGRFPSFSPDGSMLAFARNGYVWIVPVARGTERRLVRGGAPAWSPSGRRIAYIAEGGAVGIIAVHGGQPHPVNSVHGTALDWQPLPHSARNPCTPPRGSTVLASDSGAVVFSQLGLFVYGCLRELGRARLLQDDSMCYCGPVTAVRLAGRFAALQSENGKPPTVAESDTLYDLGSGKATPLASVWLQTPTRDPVHTLDSLALDSSGFAAWRETAKPLPVGFAAISCPSPSLCIAGDEGGNILSSTTPTARRKRMEDHRIALSASEHQRRLLPIGLALRSGRCEQGAHRDRPQRRAERLDAHRRRWGFRRLDGSLVSLRLAVRRRRGRADNPEDSHLHRSDRGRKLVEHSVNPV